MWFCKANTPVMLVTVIVTFFLGMAQEYLKMYSQCSQIFFVSDTDKFSFKFPNLSKEVFCHFLKEIIWYAIVKNV